MHLIVCLKADYSPACMKRLRCFPQNIPARPITQSLTESRAENGLARLEDNCDNSCCVEKIPDAYTPVVLRPRHACLPSLAPEDKASQVQDVTQWVSCYHDQVLTTDDYWEPRCLEACWTSS
ncbi:hypothetical protein ElyMa_001309500 [Elysia marginata]|uniref:Uncharacterized protein n=1 Tax=Elysia marginata TaxID=1093978 RepID=A0AAV4IJE4_9GAST|nr:hypothetical protein ElyMa_001309500 [Elysia marginata]